MSTAAPESGPPRRRRRWPRIVALIVLIPTLAAVSLPWLLNTRAGNRLVASRLAAAFAPGRLQFETIRFSWTGPTRLSDVALDDPDGTRVVTARTATLSPTLWALLTRPGRLGMLDLHAAEFEIARKPGGSIDIADALEGIFGASDPRRDLAIRAERATLLVRLPEVPAPVKIDWVDLLVLIRPAPEPTSWTVDLRNRADESLRITGDLDRWRARSKSGAKPDLTLDVVSIHWPLDVKADRLRLATRIEGKVRVERTGGLWKSIGSAELHAIKLAGSALGDGLSIEQGTARLSVVAGPSGWSIDAGLADLVAVRGDRRLTLGAPSTLSARLASSPEGANAIDLREAAIVTPYGSIRAQGRLDGLDGPANLDLKGTIAPDWKALNAFLAHRLEPGARVSGKDSAFEIRGPLRGEEATPPLHADLGIELAGADLFGMTLGATPIGVHLRDGAVSIDPMDTTLNGGTLHLRPRLELGAARGATLVFEKGSSLRDAVINDRVSRRVLSFVAPILDEATRASGRVSMTIDRAEFPIASDVGRKANVTGSVVFQDVVFAPGPLARQLIGFISPNEPGSLHLDEPVHLSIADGRVNQSGLAIPLGKLARVEVEGWVDFDKNLGLVASFPISSAMFPNRPLLGEVVAGARIRVPIGGTLSAPKVDKEAFNAGMRDMGKALLTRSVGIGALQMLNGLAKPRVVDPDAPPPPSPEERKAQRLERRNERRMGRGLAPIPDGS